MFQKKAEKTAPITLIFLAVAIAFVSMDGISKEEIILRVNIVHGVVLGWIFWVVVCCIFEKK